MVPENLSFPSVSIFLGSLGITGQENYSPHQLLVSPLLAKIIRCGCWGHITRHDEQTEKMGENQNGGITNAHSSLLSGSTVSLARSIAVWRASMAACFVSACVAM